MTDKTKYVVVRRNLIETQIFLIKTHAHASKDTILQACLESDALCGDPHDSWVKEALVTVVPANDTDIKNFHEYCIDLVDETTPNIPEKSHGNARSEDHQSA